MPFHTLVMGAVVVPYNGLGIVGLNNVHLTCTILDVISAESKSLMLKDWRSTLAAALFNSRVTGSAALLTGGKPESPQHDP